MHEFDEGLDSFRSRSVLQKSWTNSVNASVVSTAAKVHLQKFWIVLLHWSVSPAAKVHLQKFWIVLLHWSEAFDEQTPFCRLRKGIFDADRAFCQLWNGAFDDHMAFCWPWNGVLGASAGFASPGTTF